MDKNKKKTLTISSNLKKKIDTTSISTSGKKSFSVEKKRPVRLGKPIKNTTLGKANFIPDNKKKNFTRKFVEQQATKDFIKKENISYPPPLSIQKKYPPDLTQDEKKAFEEYFQLIYWNKEIKTDKGRKKIFKYYPDVNF